MNTENSKTNKLNKFPYYFTNNLNLKNLNKILHWLIRVFITLGKTLNLHIATLYLTYLLKPGMINLVYLMDHILYQLYKIIFNTLLENVKLW